MKTLLNRTFFLTPPSPTGHTEQQTTAQLVASCAKFSQVEEQRGLPIEEQRKRFRILDAAEALKDGENGDKWINLEDADATELKRLITGMRWGWVDRAFNEFHQQVEDACK